MFNLTLTQTHWLTLTRVLHLQSVPGEMEQVQPVLSGARVQEGGVQQIRGRADRWGEGAAGAQSDQTHQGSNAWSQQLCFLWPSRQVKQQSQRTAEGHHSWHPFSQSWAFLSLLFSKFTNMMMKHGEKTLARQIMTQVRKHRSWQTSSTDSKVRL